MKYLCTNLDVEPTPIWDSLIGKTVLVRILRDDQTKVAFVEYVSPFAHGVRLKIRNELLYYLPQQIEFLREANIIERFIALFYKLIPASEDSWFGTCRVCHRCAPLNQRFVWKKADIEYRVETCGLCGAETKVTTQSTSTHITGEYQNLENGEIKRISYKKQLTPEEIKSGVINP